MLHAGCKRLLPTRLHNQRPRRQGNHVPAIVGGSVPWPAAHSMLRYAAGSKFGYIGVEVFLL